MGVARKKNALNAEFLGSLAGEFGWVVSGLPDAFYSVDSF